MSRASKFILWLLCGLLISCSTPESQWRALEPSKSSKIEYQGRVIARTSATENGLGGTGKAPFAQPQNGLGGTGKQARNGLGGTGSPAEHQHSGSQQNGVGGTGKQPGKTTIVGSVTAFGSIWVNDRHILLPDETRYFRDGEQSARNDIRLGQVVAVLADEYGDDYQAVEVHSVNNVIGPLQSVQTLANGKTELQILGQRVLMDQHTRLLDQQQQAVSHQQLKTGQWLTVSGLRTPDQSIRASLIQPATQQIALLAGPLSALNGDVVLGEQRIQFDADAPQLDQPLTLTGTLVDGDFIVDDWQPMPLTRLLELADAFWLEGFPMEDAELYLEGFEVELPEAFDTLEFDDSISIGFDDEGEYFWFDEQPDVFDDLDSSSLDPSDIDPDWDDEGYDGEYDYDSYDAEHYDDHHPEYEYYLPDE